MTDNMRGALFMMGAMAGFTFNDAAMKFVSEDLSLYQAVFIRGLATTVMLGLIVGLQGAFGVVYKGRDRKIVLMRASAEVAATFFFLTALFNMPLANVTAILQALPLTITLAGAIFLAQPVGWRRMLAIAVGFSGVLLIVQPGTNGFNVFSLIALLAVVVVTFRDLITRQISAELPSSVVAFATSVLITVLAGLATALTGWSPVSAMTLAVLALAAVFVTGGYMFGVMAMRAGDVWFTSSFRYSGLIWAIGLGALLFGDIPDRLTIAGMAVVMCTGLFTIYREHLVKRRIG